MASDPKTASSIDTESSSGQNYFQIMGQKCVLSGTFPNPLELPLFPLEEKIPRPVDRLQARAMARANDRSLASSVAKGMMANDLSLASGVAEGAGPIVVVAGEVGMRKRGQRLTPTQRARVLAYAMRVKWSVRKKDRGRIAKLCAEIGINPQTLKNFINNYKKKIGMNNELELSLRI